jgi:hypothetical protein
MIKIETNEQYHSEKEHVSNTTLKKVKTSPAHFQSAFLTPYSDDSTAAQKRGTLGHDLLLEQNIDKYVKRPADKTGKQLAANTTLYKEWLATLKPGQEPCDIDLYDNLYEMLNTFVKCKSAMDLYNGAKIEQSIYTKCPDTGILIKARPDIWGKNYIADLKTSGCIADLYPNEIYKRDYDFQSAHYSEAAEAETGDQILQQFIIAFELEKPFGIQVFEIPQKYIQEAKERRALYLSIIKSCRIENRWPAYSDEVVVAERANYLTKIGSSVFDEVV